MATTTEPETGPGQVRPSDATKPGGPTAPEKKPKAPFWRRWWMIAIYVVLGLSIVGSLLPSSEKKTPTTAPAVTVTAPAVTVTAPAITVTAPAATESAPAATAAAAPTASAEAAPAAPPATPAGKKIVRHGVDGQNLRPLHLATDMDVSWKAPRNGGENFIFSTDSGSVVNALGPTRGTSFIPAGDYSDVSVVATGPWTITLTPAPPPTAIATRVVLRGVDGQNLRPLNLATDMDVSWKAPRNSGDNFIFSTDSGSVVNALGPTSGTSFIPAGEYGDVSVVASGPWAITLTPTG